jgi:NAD(P)H-dependent FMN reductase
MSVPFRLLGISGSLRAHSFSSAVLRALAEAAAPQAHFDFADIGTLPH